MDRPLPAESITGSSSQDTYSQPSDGSLHDAAPLMRQQPAPAPVPLRLPGRPRLGQPAEGGGLAMMGDGLADATPVPLPTEEEFLLVRAPQVATREAGLLFIIMIYVVDIARHTPAGDACGLYH